jgi:hypothetical protein
MFVLLSLYDNSLSPKISTSDTIVAHHMHLDIHNNPIQYTPTHLYIHTYIHTYTHLTCKVITSHPTNLVSAFRRLEWTSLRHLKPNSDGHQGLEFSNRHCGGSQANMHGYPPRPPTRVPPYKPYFTYSHLSYT